MPPRNFVDMLVACFSIDLQVFLSFEENEKNKRRTKQLAPGFELLCAILGTCDVILLLSENFLVL